MTQQLCKTQLDEGSRDAQTQPAAVDTDLAVTAPRSHRDCGTLISMGDDDWRLMGQEAYLFGRAFRSEPWTPYRDGWDHDHCEFCQAEISDTRDDHVDCTAGYVAADDRYHWICPQCFEDFRDRFSWTVVGPLPG